MPSGDEKPSTQSFPKRVLIILLVTVLAWLAWRLQFVILLIFGAVLLAIIIRTGADGLHKRLRLPQRLSYVLSLTTIFGLPSFTLWRFGAELSRQANLISAAVPSALERVKAILENAGMAEWTKTNLGEVMSGSQIYDGATGMLLGAADALTNFVIVVVAAIYVSSNPSLYRNGLLKILPPNSRQVGELTLMEVGTALSLWLKGRLLAMLLVGVLTGAGLWLIGVPSYLALGLLAALLEFIPFIGPIIAAVPAVLLALLVGPSEALLTAGLFLLIQQLEGNLITPIIQHHAVRLPPALLVFAVLGFGVLFGLIGVILAAPLTVTLFVLVKRLYVREHLGTPTPIPGSDQ